MFSRCSGQDSLSASASAMTFPDRVIARFTSPALAEPACSTTACAPIASPERSALVSAVSDLRRSERSEDAVLMR